MKPQARPYGEHGNSDDAPHQRDSNQTCEETHRPDCLCDRNHDQQRTEYDHRDAGDHSTRSFFGLWSEGDGALLTGRDNRNRSPAPRRACRCPAASTSPFGRRPSPGSRHRLRDFVLYARFNATVAPVINPLSSGRLTACSGMSSTWASAKISWLPRCGAAPLMLASLNSHRYRQLSVEQDRSALNYGQANHQKAYGRKKCNGCYQP